MRLAIRVLARILVVIAVGAIGYYGLQAGLAATSVPSLSHNRAAHSSISIGSDHENVAVSISWVLNSIGQVHLSLSQIPVTADGGELSEADPAEPLQSVLIYVKLSCDARLKAVPAKTTEDFGFLGATSGGDERGCAVYPFSQAGSKKVQNPAYQVLTFRAQDDGGELTEYPVEPWTVSGAGLRIAHTPNIQIGSFAGAIDGAFEAGFQSVLSTGVTADDSETVDEFFPQQISSGTVSFDDQMGYIGKDDLIEFASVTYSADFSKTDLIGDGGGVYILPSATVRWTQPAQQQRGQLLILFSGVALGIVAAFVVELLLVIARGPRDRPARQG